MFDTAQCLCQHGHRTPLHISVATTRNHFQRILKKLDVHTKLEAMALVSRNGWNLPAHAYDDGPPSRGAQAV